MPRILIAEDTPAMRQLLRAALEQLVPEPSFCEAENGFAALRALSRERFELLLTDINMPDIHGLELVSFARKSPLQQRLPIIVVSSEGSERDRARALALGADAYLVKPIHGDELCRIARDLLAASAKSD
jgi:two-component system chemotaxis response regulator CheY